VAGVFVFLALGCFSLIGCAALSASINRQVRADKIASESGFKREIIPTTFFQITAFSKIEEPGKPLHVYIEGDGFAWASRTRLSDDPTPFRPVALQLASQDPAANVVYLSRPCQYTPRNLEPHYDADYWSSMRFSKEVIDSMNDAVGRLKVASVAQEIHLIGYSGGGTVAVLLAARRNDIVTLRTVAGNLDPEALNRYHRVSPFRENLDPMDIASQLSNLPQRHFIGNKDNIVPSFIAENFVHAINNPRCVEITAVDAEHLDGWSKSWPELLQMSVDCSQD